MEEIRICNYLQGDDSEIHDLVKTVFDEFVSKDCNEQGIIFFYQFIDPKEFRRRNKYETFTLTAKTVNGQIVGMIEVRYDGHICLLFVKNEYKKKGIAYRLFNNAKDICIQKTKRKVKMTVNSSIFAIEIYKKLGFTTVGNEKTINGISFIEMVYKAN